MSERFNVLKPELIWLGNRCYRKMPIKQEEVLTNLDNQSDLYPMSEPLVDDENPCDIPIHGSKEPWATFYCPKALYSFMLTNRTKLSIEKETNARLIPDLKKQADTIEINIQAKNKSYVKTAYRRLEILLTSARLRANFTHFVSIPINFDNLIETYLQFKDDVLKRCNKCRGVTEDLFQTPKKLHLTIVTLGLFDNKERESAVALLQECKNTVKDLLQNKPLKILVKGIEYMNDDPKEVDVLYGKVQELNATNVLQVIADKILKKFTDAHLVVQQIPSERHQPSSVKLHVTLMNTLFRNHNNEDDFKRKRETFDASQVLENYSDYEFGLITVPEIHLSIRYSKDDSTQYYKSATVLRLN